MPVPIGLPEPFGALLEARTARPEPARPEGAEGAPSFGERLEEFVQGVDQDQRTADGLSVSYAEGQQNDLHGTMIALQKADITLRLAGSIRTHVVEAYREMMRMGA